MASGRPNLRALENLCREFPENRFLASVLSRENQHELMRLCAQVQQPDAVRLLVVPEQSIHRGGDNARTTGDAGHVVYSAAFRCTRFGASDLQVAKYAAHHGADTRQLLFVDAEKMGGKLPGIRCGRTYIGCSGAILRDFAESGVESPFGSADPEWDGAIRMDSAATYLSRPRPRQSPKQPLR